MRAAKAASPLLHRGGPVTPLTPPGLPILLCFLVSLCHWRTTTVMVSSTHPGPGTNQLPSAANCRVLGSGHEIEGGSTSGRVMEAWVLETEAQVTPHLPHVGAPGLRSSAFGRICLACMMRPCSLEKSRLMTQGDRRHCPATPHHAIHACLPTTTCLRLSAAFALLPVERQEIRPANCVTGSSSDYLKDPASFPTAASQLLTRSSKPAYLTTRRTLPPPLSLTQWQVSPHTRGAAF